MDLLGYIRARSLRRGDVTLSEYARSYWRDSADLVVGPGALTVETGELIRSVS